MGRATSERMTSDPVIEALTTAVEQRRPPAGLIHHSDKGSQLASRAFQKLLAAHGQTCSMSRKADAYDNAVAESSFGMRKTELVHLARYPTRRDARQAIFDWIEVFCNRQRLHSSLGYKSPADFEPAA